MYAVKINSQNECVGAKEGAKYYNYKHCSIWNKFTTVILLKTVSKLLYHFYSNYINLFEIIYSIF